MRDSKHFVLDIDPGRLLRAAGSLAIPVRTVCDPSQRLWRWMRRDLDGADPPRDPGLGFEPQRMGRALLDHDRRHDVWLGDREESPGPIVVVRTRLPDRPPIEQHARATVLAMRLDRS